MYLWKKKIWTNLCVRVETRFKSSECVSKENSISPSFWSTISCRICLDCYRYMLQKHHRCQVGHMEREWVLRPDGGWVVAGKKSCWWEIAKNKIRKEHVEGKAHRIIIDKHFVKFNWFLACASNVFESKMENLSLNICSVLLVALFRFFVFT